jgi:hypothetical protein
MILKRINRMIEEADVLLAARYRLGGLPARDPVPGHRQARAPVP